MNGPTNSSGVDNGGLRRFRQIHKGQAGPAFVIVPVTDGSCVRPGVFSRQHNVFSALTTHYFHVEADHLSNQSMVDAAGFL